MKVISTNISEPKTITWKGKKEQTGIFKKSVNEIYLGKTDVEKDAVIDRKYHGGIDRACYIYSANHYEFWKSKYPDLDWHLGMFGENLTIENLNETELFIGDTFEIGEAIIQISEPRMPCYKLGIRFNTPKIIKEFTNSTFCGSYARVLKEGIVKPNDELKLIEKKSNMRLSELYKLLSTDKKNSVLIEKALRDNTISNEIKQKLK